MIFTFNYGIKRGDDLNKTRPIMDGPREKITHYPHLILSPPGYTIQIRRIYFGRTANELTLHPHYAGRIHRRLGIHMYHNEEFCPSIFTAREMVKVKRTR